MAKDSHVHEELDEWLAQGRIDQETHDRLAEDADGPRLQEPLGLLTGAAGIALGLGLRYLILNTWFPEWGMIAAVSVTLMFLVTALSLHLVWGGRAPETGRCLAIVASALWSQAVEAWLLANPDRYHFCTWLWVLAAGHGALAYACTSALVLGKGLMVGLAAVACSVAERTTPDRMFTAEVCTLMAAGGLLLLAAREHLVRRWPPGPVFRRFVLTYHLVGLWTVNGCVLLVSWLGWDGEGYEDVTMRLLGVAATAVVYGMEIWAGQRSRMAWVTGLGILHFLLQCILILNYPFLSLQLRALVVIALGVLLVLIAQGEPEQVS